MIIAVSFSADLPQGASRTLFRTSGVVHVAAITGLVTENLTSSNEGLSGSMISTLSITSRAAGFVISGAPSGLASEYPSDGTNITINTSGANAGKVEWYLLYEQVSPGSSVYPV